VNNIDQTAEGCGLVLVGTGAILFFLLLQPLASALIFIIGG